MIETETETATEKARDRDHIVGWCSSSSLDYLPCRPFSPRLGPVLLSSLILCKSNPQERLIGRVWGSKCIEAPGGFRTPGARLVPLSPGLPPQACPLLAGSPALPSCQMLKHGLAAQDSPVP